jgi:hypothetical protein
VNLFTVLGETGAPPLYAFLNLDKSKRLSCGWFNMAMYTVIDATVNVTRYFSISLSVSCTSNRANMTMGMPR